ncbi:hypothetical protein DBR47_08515 [Paucibacter sp. KBW04]|uniref:ExeA family protein n=1 Tax=Paucibacter sp. KBW04 TaxID=2153361 RepID=UPI000F569104|nr:AAA family ATPase [Paucibacter sp. KBW04]RQO60398.1 hypothetical protein DBR47_08515 [Paucibacter sp. KBW04]
MGANAARTANTAVQTNDPGQAFFWQPEAGSYFATASLELLRLGLRAGLESGHGVLVLTGEVGSGKTLLLRMALQNLPAADGHTAYLSYTSMSGHEILQSIAFAFGMPSGADAPALTPQDWLAEQLKTWAARAEPALLVIDEAQSLPPETLLSLLKLNQLRPKGRHALRVILVGQTPLLNMLKAPELQAFAADIGPRFHLSPLRAEESHAFIQSRLLLAAADHGPTEFKPEAYEAIHACCVGNPGRIKLLCKHLLQSAWLMDEQQPIDAAMVAAQAEELGLDPALALSARGATTASSRQGKGMPASAQGTPGPAAPKRQHAHRPLVGMVTAGLVLLATGLGALKHWPELLGVAPQTTAQQAATPELQNKPWPTPPSPLINSQSSASTGKAVANASAPSATASEPPPPVALAFDDPSSAALGSRVPPIKPALPAQASTSKTGNKACANLLARLSLGEPLSAKDRRELDEQCR